MTDVSLYTLTGVSFAYGQARILEDISLELAPNRFYGIVGPNGCGKTTFLDLLTGTRQPLQGTISYLGREIHLYARRELAKQLALVPQEFDTGFGFTVEEIVLMGRHPHIRRFKNPAEEDWLAVDQAMASIGISQLKNRFTNNLSGGQKQRVVVARALAQNASVLLFDEATSSLDIKYTLQIFNIARRLVREEGRTVIAVIHNLNLAAAYCDQLLFMKGGRIIRYGATEETMTADTISEIFDVEASIHFDPFNNTRQVSFQYWQS